jgi:hypothetical protein
MPLVDPVTIATLPASSEAGAVRRAGALVIACMSIVVLPKAA